MWFECTYWRLEGLRFYKRWQCSTYISTELTNCIEGCTTKYLYLWTDVNFKEQRSSFIIVSYPICVGFMNLKLKHNAPFFRISLPEQTGSWLLHAPLLHVMLLTPFSLKPCRQTKVTFLPWLKTLPLLKPFNGEPGLAQFSVVTRKTQSKQRKHEVRFDLHPLRAKILAYLYTVVELRSILLPGRSLNDSPPRCIRDYTKKRLVFHDKNDHLFFLR